MGAFVDEAMRDPYIQSLPPSDQAEQRKIFERVETNMASKKQNETQMSPKFQGPIGSPETDEDQRAN